MLYGDLLRYIFLFTTNSQLSKRLRVCGEWQTQGATILDHRLRAHKLIAERVRMTCEDERRFLRVTYTHLMALVREWIDCRVGSNPWWNRQPARKRGALVDAQDSMGAWNPAVIEDWHVEWRMRPPIAPHSAVHRTNGRFGTARTDSTVRYHVRFLGWTRKWDEFVPCNRISGLGTRTYHYPNNYVHASRQWSLCRNRDQWDVRLVHPYAVSSLSDVLPLTDVLAALLVPLHRLACVEL